MLVLVLLLRDSQCMTIRRVEALLMLILLIVLLLLLLMMMLMMMIVRTRHRRQWVAELMSRPSEVRHQSLAPLLPLFILPHE